MFSLKPKAAKTASATKLPDPMARHIPAGWIDLPTADQSIQIVRATAIEKVTPIDRTDSNAKRCRVWLTSGHDIAVALTVREMLNLIAPK
jgi:hypothetical protein